MRVSRLAGLVLGAGLVFLPAGPASADPVLNCNVALSNVCEYVNANTGGQCNGTADVNCDYCSYNGQSYASSNYHCEDGDSGYDWIACTVWAGTCVIG